MTNPKVSAVNKMGILPGEKRATEHARMEQRPLRVVATNLAIYSVATVMVANAVSLSRKSDPCTKVMRTLR